MGFIKIAFFGSGIFSLPLLKALNYLHSTGKIDLRFIVSQRSKSFGRDKKIIDNPVVGFCKETGLKLYTPEKVIELKNHIVEEELDLCIVASYGKIIPASILELPRYGFINFHGSILPKYRGAVPVQKIVLNQDYENLGVSVIKVDEGMDTGDVILAKHFDLKNFESFTSGELMILLGEFSKDLLLSNFEYLMDPSKWILKRQDHSLATYCYVKDMDKSNFEIFFKDSAVKVHGKIMSGNPEPKAFVNIDGYGFNLLRSRLHTDARYVIDNVNDFRFYYYESRLFLNLADKSQAIEILELQPFSKKTLTAGEFINGYRKFTLIY